MHQNEITKLALKLMGIYILTKVILYIPSLVTVVSILVKSTSEIKTGTIAFFAPIIILLVFGIWLTIKNKPELENFKGLESNLLPVGLAIAGVIIFASAIGELPFFVVKLFHTFPYYTSVEVVGTYSNLENIMKLVGNLIQLGLGSVLFFKAKYFSNLIK